MGPFKKKVFDELNEAFPLRFPDGEEERIILQQQALLIELDTTFFPDDPSLQSRIESFNLEIQERLKPAKLTGKGNQLEEIRSTYVANKIALQLEGLPVDDKTPSLQYWQYLTAIESKYKRKPSLPHESLE
ncbi:hypothetical protein [Spirosoma flavum]|uniref:Uncharacterized protein n=1 Tax=Spirosoma flavum TaxID=2048557 RepID=A0ABW6ANX8_9BACT